jgi:O-antigen ligase
VPVEVTQRLTSLTIAVPVGLLAAALAVLSAALNPLLPLAIAGGLVVLAIGYHRPLWLIYLAVLTLPLEFKLQQFGFFQLTPAKGLLLAGAVGWAIGQLVHKRPLVVRTPLTLPLIALIVIMLPGLIVAVDKLIVLNTLVIWMAWFCLYQAVVQSGDERFVRRLLICLAVAAVGLGYLAITDASFHGQAASSGGNTVTGRADAGFGSPNLLAALLLMTVLPAVSLTFSGQTWKRVAFAAAAGIGIYGLLLTESRGGFLGLAVGLLTMVTWRPVRRASIVGIIVLIALAIAGINPLGNFLGHSAIGERVGSITTSAARIDPRIPVYERTLTVIGDHPLFGVGANDYIAAAIDYGIMVDGFPPGHPHNALLTIAADRGLIGLAIFLVFIFMLGLMLIRGLAHSIGERRAMLTGVTAVFVATAAHNMVDYTLASVELGIVFVVAGAAVVLTRAAEPAPDPVVEEPRESPERPLLARPSGQPAG